jgi:hypothetical protein
VARSWIQVARKTETTQTSVRYERQDLYADGVSHPNYPAGPCPDVELGESSKQQVNTYFVNAMLSLTFEEAGLISRLLRDAKATHPVPLTRRLSAELDGLVEKAYAKQQELDSKVD